MKIYAMAVIGCVGLAGCAGTPVLTGDWSGVYTYNHPQVENGAPTQVPFKARLIQTGDRLEGTISEPNTFQPLGITDREELNAILLAGQVTDSEVWFRKEYNVPGHKLEPIDYRGTLDSRKRTLTGQWNIERTVGSFTMSREK
jgi:hypothetical protein